MDKNKLNHYKELLLKEKDEVLEEIMEVDETAKALMEEEEHNVNDSVDLANLSINQNLLKSMSKKNQDKIMAIEAALKRIEENTFGICISCGNPIEENRLEAVPWATKCISCKNSEEQRKKNHH